MKLADETAVVDVFAPGELHELIGGVGHPMNLLIKLYGLEFIEKWTKSQGIIRHGYHSGGYDGNNLMRILDHLDNLAGYLPPECAPIMAVLRTFKEVVHGEKLWQISFFFFSKNPKATISKHCTHQPTYH